MDWSAVLKTASIKSMNALTANSVNGVLLRDAAVVLVSADTTLRRPTKRNAPKGPSEVPRSRAAGHPIP